MFPIGDENPQLRIPVVTYALIALNVATWVLLQNLGAGPGLYASVCQFGLIPADLFNSIPPGMTVDDRMCPANVGLGWGSLVSSMFMHGGWMHLIGNMWFLWVFGDNVEDSMGRMRFAIFYVACGLLAAATQVYSQPDSSVPMVGASGAIGGVMGAYIMLYPRVKVTMLLFLVLIVTTFRVPAFAMLGYWIVVQLLGGLSSVGVGGGGTAFWAHVGGFVAGALLVWFFKDNQLLRNHPHYGW